MRHKRRLLVVEINLSMPKKTLTLFDYKQRRKNKRGRLRLVVSLVSIFPILTVPKIEG